MSQPSNPASTPRTANGRKLGTLFCMCLTSAIHRGVVNISLLQKKRRGGPCRPFLSLPPLGLRQFVFALVLLANRLLPVGVHVHAVTLNFNLGDPHAVAVIVAVEDSHR